jgi:hypothetical protein
MVRVVGGSGADSMFRFQLKEKRQDKVLLEDEVKAASLSWLHGKKA